MDQYAPPSGVVFIAEEPALPWCLRQRKQVPKELRRGFDSLVFLIGWMLWKERNARTFNNVAATAAQLAAIIKVEAESWCQAGFKQLGRLMAML